MSIMDPYPVSLYPFLVSSRAVLFCCVAFLTPPQLRLGRLPFIKITSSTLNDRLPCEGLPSLRQVAVLEILLELRDVGAEAVVGEGECAWSRVFGSAALDLRKEHSVGGILREHRNQGRLLLVTEARPGSGLEKHVVDIGLW
jgi:hypothetical protein